MSCSVPLGLLCVLAIQSKSKSMFIPSFILAAFFSLCTAVALQCSPDNCLRAVRRFSPDANTFCHDYLQLPPITTAIHFLPSKIAQYPRHRISSACSCISGVLPTTSVLIDPRPTPSSCSHSASSCGSKSLSTPLDFYSSMKPSTISLMSST